MCAVQASQSAALERAGAAVTRFCRLMHARSTVQRVVADSARAVRLRRLAAELRAAGAAVAERRLQGAHRERTTAMCRGLVHDIVAAAAARGAFPAAVRAVMRRRVVVHCRRITLALADAATHAAGVRTGARAAVAASAATERWVTDARAMRAAGERDAMRRWLRRFVQALAASTPALSRHKSRLIAEGLLDGMINESVQRP